MLEINRLRVGEDYAGIQLVITSRIDLRSSHQWQAFHLLDRQRFATWQRRLYAEIETASRLVLPAAVNNQAAHV